MKFINNLNRKNINIVSIDLPSGLHPDTSVAYPETISADNTIMCLTRKQGCYTGKASNIREIFFYKFRISNYYKFQNSSNILIDNKDKFYLKEIKLPIKESLEIF